MNRTQPTFEMSAELLRSEVIAIRKETIMHFSVQGYGTASGRYEHEGGYMRTIGRRFHGDETIKVLFDEYAYSL